MELPVGKRLTDNGRLYQGNRLLGVVSYDLRVIDDHVAHSTGETAADGGTGLQLEGTIEVDADDALVGVELRLELVDGRWCTLTLADNAGKVQGTFL